MKVILIDDKPEMQTELKAALEKICSSSTLDCEFSFEIWDQSILSNKYNANQSDDESSSNAVEDVWFRALSNEQDIAGIVVDHDLSALQLYISESAITSACKKASIPVCTYHRKPTQSTDSTYLRKIVSQAKSFSINIEIDKSAEMNSAAKEIIDVFTGFQVIKKWIVTNSTSNDKGPSKTLSLMLDKPHLENFFSRYAYDFSIFDEVLEVSNNDVNEATFGKKLQDKLSFIIGCWLYNNILPFPGVILNQVSAAAYINLAQPDFIANSDKFQNAEYLGPFSSTQKYWWRFDLDAVLDKSDSNDGLEMLTKLGVENVEPSKCHKSGAPNAQYYCLVKKEPVALDQSIGSISWVPKGADLSRVTSDIYERFAPIMGL